ncbi:peptidase MA superfamily [Olene mendosa nucleopolyhedrovirus]|uniref:Peptidase MA superfamily n=1 Tax=Olene mendosa nucleopolyhedrovirus TaxID=2933796 RepID=A0AAX3AUL4_9ABAC|nr:peptidase MA superfamily [Olene mendosa nucleopolyhedrovirus]UOQ18898.1 peptidase MA superfamily [Olene mendosa nucleopolyhedrovirus]
MNLIEPVVVALFVASATAYTAEELTALTDEVCVPTRFLDAACHNATLLGAFEAAQFDFRRGADVKRYAVWLRLVNNLEYYASAGDRPRLMETLARRSKLVASINTNVTAEMRADADEMFRWTIDTWSRYHDRRFDAFVATFAAFRDFMNSFVLWCDSDAAYFLRAALYGYRAARKSFVLDAQRALVDEAAAQTAALAFQYPLLRLDPELARRLVYIHYVIELKPPQRAAFGGLYRAVDKNSTMTRTDSFRAGRFTIALHHGTANDSLVAAMRDEAQFVFKNFMQYFSSLRVNVTDYPTTIDVFVHADKPTYTLTGPLWAIRTDNGGFTHISSQTKRITSHVYFETDAELPRNFGHELHHAFLFAVTEVSGMPAWYVEGAANRYGNRPCYRFDHDSLESYAHVTVRQILAADYADDYLYGMGSALVAFLHEQRPKSLKRMIETNNYTISPDARFEADFELFRINKIYECRRAYSASGARADDGSGVQEQYLQYADSQTFAECRNYIEFDFRDVVFLMTPAALIKVNKRHALERINAQREIAKYHLAPAPLSRQDFEWFLEGALTRALEYMGDTHHSLKVDRSSYDYESKATCLHGDENKPRAAVVRFASRTPQWQNFYLFTNKTEREARYALANYLALRAQCSVYLNPPTSLKPEFARALFDDGRAEFTDAQIVQAVDLRRNSILHLAALHNARLFETLASRSRSAARSLKNLDNMTPRELRAYADNYRARFRTTPPSRLCFAYIETEPSPTISPTTSPEPSPTTSPTTSPEPSPTTKPSTTTSPTTSPEPSPTTSPEPNPTTSPEPSPTTSPEPSHELSSTPKTTANNPYTDKQKNKTRVSLWFLLLISFLVLIDITFYLMCF